MDELQTETTNTNQNTSKNWFAITFLLVVAAIIALAAWLNFLKKRKVLKQEAAKKYGITTKVLANWIALICPLDLSTGQKAE